MDAVERLPVPRAMAAVDDEALARAVLAAAPANADAEAGAGGPGGRRGRLPGELSMTARAQSARTARDKAKKEAVANIALKAMLMQLRSQLYEKDALLAVYMTEMDKVHEHDERARAAFKAKLDEANKGALAVHRAALAGVHLADPMAELLNVENYDI